MHNSAHKRGQDRDKDEVAALDVQDVIKKHCYVVLARNWLTMDPFPPERTWMAWAVQARQEYARSLDARSEVRLSDSVEKKVRHM
jgi:hypothetical protein